jgi:hypothetical protein
MHHLRSKIALATAAAFCLMTTASFAAVDATTGIDWSATGSDVLTAAKPAILAGLAIMVVLLAVTLGRKMFSKVAK